MENHQKKIEPFLKTYVNENDERFSWMTNQFLTKPNTWKENTQNRSVDSLKMLDLKCISVCKHIMAYKLL